MDNIIASIQNLDANDTTMFVAFVSISVFLLILVIYFIISASQSTVKKRIKKISDRDAMDTFELNINSQLNKEQDDEFDKFIGSFGKYVTPKDEEELSEIEKKLKISGFISASASTKFYLLKTATGLLFPLITFAYIYNGDFSFTGAIFLVAMSAGIGVFGPNIILNKIYEKRHSKLRHGLPDTLDMLVSCVEAGISLDAALNRVADSIALSHKELSDELALVNASIRAGVPRQKALNGMIERTGMDDLQGLVSLIEQSSRFGSSIAESLRVFSADIRDQRMKRAEEQAGKLSTKLIFPMIFFIWPAFFVVAVGPAFLQFKELFGQ